MRLRDLIDRLTPVWRVERPTRTQQGGVHRVSARVGGREVWFESGDVPLVPSTEGIAGMFIVPAIRAKKKLRTAEPVDPLWVRNIEQVTAIWRRWAGPSGGSVLLSRCHPASKGTARPETALFFSGGVDSFYSLLRGPKVDALVHVHGFDAPPADAERLAKFEPEFRRIARRVGCRAVLIRTNLREHSGFRRAGWPSSHGGALAGVAHLLESSFGTMAISSSDTGIFDVPWGSHQDTDPLYSSGTLNIRHRDEHVHRLEKHRAISAEPLVREHLWVCWKGRGPRLNCGHCEKCLRTMVCLLGLGELERSLVFDCPAEDLAARVDRLLPVKNPYIKVYWADMLEELELPAELQAAARNMLARSDWDPSQVNRRIAADLRGGHAGSVIDEA